MTPKTAAAIVTSPSPRKKAKKANLKTVKRQPSSQKKQLDGTVGIREMKQNLSQVIDQVKDGRVLIVTAHGKAVAKIVPLDVNEESIIEQYIAAGLASAAKDPTAIYRAKPKPYKGKVPLSEILDEIRSDVI